MPAARTAARGSVCADASAVADVVVDATVIELAYRIVDVFSDRPLAGNALCVVVDACPEPLMAGIAREVNLSETTFPTVTADGAYRTRIWTPGGELPFAGHPTLGTAWVLGAGRWEQAGSARLSGDRARVGVGRLADAAFKVAGGLGRRRVQTAADPEQWIAT